jgi:hypothetical protein
MSLEPLSRVVLILVWQGNSVLLILLKWDPHVVVWVITFPVLLSCLVLIVYVAIA